MVSLCSRAKFESKPISPSLGGNGRKTMANQRILKVHFSAQLTYSVSKLQEFHMLEKVREA